MQGMTPELAPSVRIRDQVTASGEGVKFKAVGVGTLGFQVVQLVSELAIGLHTWESLRGSVVKFVRRMLTVGGLWLSQMSLAPQ